MIEQDLNRTIGSDELCELLCLIKLVREALSERFLFFSVVCLVFVFCFLCSTRGNCVHFDFRLSA